MWLQYLYNNVVIVFIYDNKLSIWKVKKGSLPTELKKDPCPLDSPSKVGEQPPHTLLSHGDNFIS